jgi:hypothetical protein
MDIVEQAKIRLVIDGKDAVNELQVIDAKITSLREKQKEYAKGTAEYKQLNGEIRELEKSYQLVEQRMDISKMTMQQLKKYQSELNREIQQMDPASKAFENTSARIKEVSARQQELGGMVKGQQGIWASLGGWIKGAFVLSGIMAMINWVIDMGKAIFDVTGKFEQYNTTLKNMFKSQEVATMAMDMIKKEAAKTNWSVDQLTDSFIKLKGRGINMTSKDIQGISDVSNYLKKDFGQVVEAINDINNTERWNEIGIKAKTNGDKVSLTFNGVTKEVARTEAGVLSAITEFGQMNGVMGLTAEIAEGLTGKQSNLGDKVMFLASTIGEKLKPVFNFILDLFIKGVDIVGDFVDKSAPLGVVFDMISKTVGSVAKSFMSLFYEIFPDAKKSTFDMATLVKILATAFALMLTPIKIVMSLLNGLIDTYKVLYLAMNTAWAGMKGDFKGMAEGAVKTELAWNKLKSNAVTNFSDIGKSFSEIWKKGDADVKKSGMTFDEWVAKKKKGEDEVTGNAGKNAKEREAAAKKTAAELEKAHKAMLKEIEKANDLADKNIRKSLEEHVKAVKINNADELKAHEKLQDGIRESALKLAAFKDAAMKLERVKRATSLEEIEQIEKEYADKALKRELENSKEKLRIKEREFLLLKTGGLLYKEEEDKRSAEILKLKNEVADKELAIVKKGVEEKTRIQKDEEKKSDDYADRKRKGLKTGLDFEILSWQMFGVSLKDLTAQQYKDLEEAAEDQIKLLENKAERLKMLKKVAYDEAYKLAQNYISNAGNEIDALISNTTDKVEKARLESRKISNEMGKSFIDTVASFATGDVSGGISGLIGVLSGAVELFNQNARILVAELEVLYDKLSADANFLMSNVDAVKSIYGDMAFDMPSFEDYSKVTSAIEQAIGAEIKLGQQIQDNYNLAVSNENDLYNKAVNNENQNYETAKANEEKLYNDAIDKINKEYDAEIAAINKKYDYEQQKANEEFGQQSLAIQEQTNAELMALVTNNDTKLSLTSEYEGKKASIMAAFASQIKPLTADMSQAEIDGINKATEARDAQLSKLEGWLTDEQSFVINNEGQKRKEYSATELIIKNGQERLNDLAIKHSADEIARTTARNVELAAADAKKISDTEAAEKSHLEVMAGLWKTHKEAIEAITKTHEDILTGLGIARDAALEASFNRLKEAMNSGYQEMIDNAEKLYQKGIITANQFVELVNQIRYFKSLLNDGGYTDTGNPADVPFIEPIVIPKFASGTEFLDPEAKAGFGTDKVLIFGDRGERILDKNLNAMLGGISNEELVRRAVGGVRTSNAGLVNRINSSAVAGFGFAQPKSPLAPSGGNRTISSNSHSSVSNIYNNTNFNTATMEQLLGDIHRAIVEKPILDMGTLNNASNAVAVNVAKSRFA